MNLTDTGPLTALADRNDPAHARCVAALSGLTSSPLLTTWPCFTEAMYLLHREGGLPAQRKLWTLRQKGVVVIHSLTDAEADRIQALMEQYRDIPMDLADASLVAVAESLELSHIFTLDKHFHAYRIFGSGAFNVVP